MPIQTSQSKARYREAWTGDSTYATCLLLMLVDTYGTEALGWDFRTIKMEVEEDFDLELPQASFDRLMVAINLVVTDDFYRSLPDFIAWCNILDGDRYDPRIFDPADSTEIAWGITEALLIDAPEEDEPFSEEVLAYIGSVLDMEGIINPPDILRIAARSQAMQLQDVEREFADDPDMYAVIYDFEQLKTAAINDHVKTKLSHLARQLEAIPLREGSTEGVLRRLMRSLE